MEYSLYHDESMVGGYWHGIFLAPIKNKYRLIELLSKVRENTGYDDPLSIKNVKNNSGRVFTCADSWLLLAVGSMRTKLGNSVFHTHYGERIKGILKYEVFNECLGLKFILFRSLDAHKGMDLLTSHSDKIETTFRIGLKGGIHYLGADNEPIDIVDMHFDGHEHYGRNINHDRIVGRLQGLRDYCKLSVAPKDIHDHTSDHRKLLKNEYGDCQLLQLVDLLVGSFRSRLGYRTRECHRDLDGIITLPLSAYQRGYRGYMNSRWANSFWMSQCQIVDGNWTFHTLEYQPDNQMKFMFTEPNI